MIDLAARRLQKVIIENNALCWCNDEFLLNGSAPNRIVGETLVHGTFYISGNYQNEYGECVSSVSV